MIGEKNNDILRNVGAKLRCPLYKRGEDIELELKITVQEIKKEGRISPSLKEWIFRFPHRN